MKRLRRQIWRLDVVLAVDDFDPVRARKPEHLLVQRATDLVACTWWVDDNSIDAQEARKTGGEPLVVVVFVRRTLAQRDKKCRSVSVQDRALAKSGYFDQKTKPLEIHVAGVLNHGVTGLKDALEIGRSDITDN